MKTLPAAEWRPGHRKPKLTISQILAWADAHHRRTGAWPSGHSGRVVGAPGEDWRTIRNALYLGLRGFPRGSSLYKVLYTYRGVPFSRAFIRGRILTYRMIREWAQDHYRRTGRWPASKSGRVLATRDERWDTLEKTLYKGGRGLPGGSSIAKLLGKRPGSLTNLQRPRLRIAHVLKWADAHHQRTGRWPMITSGPIREAPGESWQTVHSALRAGTRGLRGGRTLARLLRARRGVPIPLQRRSLLTIEQILKWADAHKRRTGDWPKTDSGRIAGAKNEIWYLVDTALRQGQRGLAGRSSLARLLVDHRGRRNIQALPKLTLRQIETWAQAHHRRTGQWPTRISGPVPEMPGDTWSRINYALKYGSRGLPRRLTLSQFLLERLGVEWHKRQPSLSERMILLWARAHHRRTGKWPNPYTGKITDAPAETWYNVDNALKRGLRNLPGGSSLREFLHGRRLPKPIVIFPRRSRYLVSTG